MRRNLSFVVVSVVATALFSACIQQEDNTTAQATSEALVAAAPASVSANLAVHKVTLPHRDSADIVRQAQRIASAMLGTSVSPDAFRRTQIADRVVRIIDSSVGMHVSYDADFDMFRVTDLSVSQDYQSEADVGEASAKEIFQTVASSLVATNAVARNGLDFNAPTLELDQQGEGVAGEPPTMRTKEYVFVVGRRVGGAVIRHGNLIAGIQVAVHRSGKISSVRVAGPAIGDQPTQQIAAVVSESDASRAIARDYSNHSHTRRGLEYVFDDSIQGFRLVWTYGVSSNIAVNGRTIHGRVQLVSYPVDDPNSVYRWPVAEPNATGDQR